MSNPSRCSRCNHRPGARKINLTKDKTAAKKPHCYCECHQAKQARQAA